MSRWTFSTTTTPGGRFIPVITKFTQGGHMINVSRVRGAPTRIDSFSSGDPFGDSTAVLTFPAITAFDDLDSTDLGRWLGYYSNVDLYWAPAIDPGGGIYPSYDHVIDPVTNQNDLVAPYRLRSSGGQPLGMNAKKVWEGFIASMSPQEDGLQIQCQGALFQLDRYLAKPIYPTAPWPLEALIADQFSHLRKPHLRTGPLSIVWPTGWSRIVPKYAGPSADIYTPVARPGTKWTGYTSRQTGGWDHALTGFVQDQLTVMITRPGDGVTNGDQWTITQRLGDGLSTPGRQPVLRVRRRFATPDFSMWLGTPGLSVQMSGDSTQSENIIFGSGTDVHGTLWRNAVIADDGSRTDYLPLAASRDVYPYHGNKSYVRGGFVSEAMTKFSTGFSQIDATDVAKQNLARDSDPGWTGSISLSTDPSAGLSRWQIRAGMVMRLKGFMGSGDTGVLFHISAVTINPEGGTADLTVDTRFRDLLTVQEAYERTRDPLTPVKMLQVNRQSVMIPDVQAPWDYTAGSGYIPKASKAFHDHVPLNQPFPYADWASKHNPLHYGSWYIACKAGSAKRNDRWAGPVPVLTSEKGDILRTEVVCYDKYGRVLKIPFHVSFYQLPVGPSAMPRDAGGPSAFIDNAFESTNPVTGQPWPKGNYLQPPDSFIVGWGNRQQGIYNRAGFSPGSEAEGNNPTGMFFDGASWGYDNTGNRGYLKNPPPGYKQTAASITIYAMFYAEYSESVFFMGRLYRANPGTE